MKFWWKGTSFYYYKIQNCTANKCKAWLILLNLQKEIHLNINYEKDESYTPNRVLVKAGYNEGGLISIHEEDIVKPNGWVPLQLICTSSQGNITQ